MATNKDAVRGAMYSLDSSGNVTGLTTPSGATAAFLATRSATYIPLGDSRVANGNVGDSGVSVIIDSVRAVHNHLQTLLQGRLVQLRNAGISGNTSTQMLNRIQTDVIAYSPGWCFLEGPVNDVTAIVTFSIPWNTQLSTMQSNVKSMWALCVSNGIRFATSTISPWTGSAPVWNAQQNGLHSAYNRWVKAWAQANNIPCADNFETNALPSTNQFIPNSVYDAYGHYSDWGAFLAAQAWFKVLDPVIPKANFLIGRNNDYDNLVYDGGGAWTVGASLPSTWSCAGTNITGQVNSVVARPDIVQGSLLQATGTSAAQGSNVIFTRTTQDYLGTTWSALNAGFLLSRRMLANDGNQYIVTTAGTTGASQPVWNSTLGDTTVDGSVTWTRVANFLSGDLIYAEAEVFISSISGGNLGVQPQIVMQHTGGGGNLVASGTTDQSTRVSPYPAGYYVLRTRPYVIGAGCTWMIANVRFFFDNSVAFTVQVGRVSYRHFTPV